MEISADVAASGPEDCRELLASAQSDASLASRAAEAAIAGAVVELLFKDRVLSEEEFRWLETTRDGSESLLPDCRLFDQAMHEALDEIRIMVSELSRANAIDLSRLRSKIIEGIEGALGLQESVNRAAKRAFAGRRHARSGVVVLEGHDSWVGSASFNREGDRVLTTSLDGTARVWDLDGRPLATMTGRLAKIRWASFFPDGNRILAIDSGGALSIFDVDGRLLAERSLDAPRVQFASFDPAGSRIIVTGSSGGVDILDDALNTVLAVQDRAEHVLPAIFSPDGRQFIAPAVQGGARLFDIHGNEQAELKGAPYHQIFSVAFSPDGKRILGATKSGKILIWDLGGGRLATLAELRAPMVYAGFSGDGRHVLALTDLGAPAVLDLQGNRVDLPWHRHGYVSTVTMDASGNKVAGVQGKGRVVRVWDLEANLVATLKGHSDCIDHVTFSRDGSRLVTVSRDHTARIWDFEAAGDRVGSDP